MNIKISECSWIGDAEHCTNMPITGKSYCSKHYDRVYTTMYPEMADYIIDKEQKSVDSLIIKSYN